MASSPPPRRTPAARWIGRVVVLLLVAVALYFTLHRLPSLQSLLAPSSPATDAHDHHDHAHSSGLSNSIQLSPQARKNIGLTLTTVELDSFQRTITLPGIVVERPGRSAIEVTAPMTGVVTRIYPIQGQTVEPGQPLFELRLVHEELVQAQSAYLQTIEELDVLQQELDRLQRATATGAVAGRTLLERQYEQQRQQATLRSQRQALLLHGLTELQVERINDRRELLKHLTVVAPNPPDMPDAEQPASLLQVTRLHVGLGQHVEAGSSLCSLADHAELYIEGTAFQEDAPAINTAAAQGLEVDVVLESGSSPSRELLPNLDILYVSSEVEVESRALHFYVVLPNQLVRQTESPEGTRFVYWRFKPGQRMQIRVPVERWERRIVLPSTAIAQDGPHAYVFVPNGNQFDRREVHLEYRDRLHSVIALDGSLYPGDQVVATGAQQMQLALKNQTSGPIDPHAGHNH